MTESGTNPGSAGKTCKRRPSPVQAAILRLQASPASAVPAEFSAGRFAKFGCATFGLPLLLAMLMEAPYKLHASSCSHPKRTPESLATGVLFHATRPSPTLLS